MTCPHSTAHSPKMFSADRVALADIQAAVVLPGMFPKYIAARIRCMHTQYSKCTNWLDGFGIGDTARLVPYQHYRLQQLHLRILRKELTEVHRLFCKYQVDREEFDLFPLAEDVDTQLIMARVIRVIGNEI